MFSSIVSNLVSTFAKIQIACPQHSQNLIESFCLKEGCSTPYCCTQCIKTHPADHAKFFINVKKLFHDGSINKEYSKLNSDYSATKVKTSYLQTIQIIDKIEDEILSITDKLRKKVSTFFIDLTEKLDHKRNLHTQFNKLKEAVYSSEQNSTIKQLRELVKGYSTIRRSSSQSSFQFNLQILPEQFANVVKIPMTKIKEQLLLIQSIDFETKPTNFSNLPVKKVHQIPDIRGVPYEGTVFISKWNIVAIGFQDAADDTCLGLYSLTARSIIHHLDNVHSRPINHVKWIEHLECLVTCSSDKDIKIYAVQDQGRKLQHVKTFSGHTDEIRCLKYLEREDLLASAGIDPDIKIWDLKRFRKVGVISTDYEGDMDGCLAYLPEPKLIGAGFRSGVIRLYHLYTKLLVFQLRTGFENYYIYGLNYLPKRRLILASVNACTIKIWKYDPDAKVIREQQTVKTKCRNHHCIIYNEDESQIMFATSKDFIESYDIVKNESAQHPLTPNVRSAMSILYLKSLKKILACDSYTGNMCLLSES